MQPKYTYVQTANINKMPLYTTTHCFLGRVTNDGATPDALAI